MIYLKLYLEFFKIGLFSVGGGLATLPFIHQLIDKYDWITQEQLLDMIAISESTPGPLGINTATFVGNTAGGIFGSLAATLGVVTPSIIIIIVIAHYFAKFSEEPLVKSAFFGIRPAVVGLIGAAGFQVAKIALFNIDKYTDTGVLADIFDIRAIALFSIMLFAITKFKKHPILYLVVAAVIGIVFKF